MGKQIKKRPKEIVYEKLLEGALTAFIYTIEAVRHVIKTKRRLIRPRTR